MIARRGLTGMAAARSCRNRSTLLSPSAYAVDVGGAAVELTLKIQRILRFCRRFDAGDVVFSMTAQRKRPGNSDRCFDIELRQAIRPECGP